MDASTGNDGIVLPKVKHIAFQKGERGKLAITFGEPLTGGQFGVCIDTIRQITSDALLAYRLDEPDWLSVCPHAEDVDEMRRALRGYTAAFKPHAPLTAVGTYTQSRLSYEATFEVVNFGDDTEPSELGQLEHRLDNMGEILAVERHERAFTMQLRGKFEEQEDWVADMLAKHAGVRITLYDRRHALILSTLSAFLGD